MLGLGNDFGDASAWHNARRLHGADGDFVRSPLAVWGSLANVDRT
jgi:hypothetical protein